MKKILLLIIVSLMFSTNVYAKKAKGSSGKGGFSAKSAPAQTNKTMTPATKSAPAPAANAAAPAAAAQKPSLLQSAMPALVGGAVGSYVGSKLASDGEAESAVSEAEKKEDHPLTAR